MEKNGFGDLPVAYDQTDSYVAKDGAIWRLGRPAFSETWLARRRNSDGSYDKASEIAGDSKESVIAKIDATSGMPTPSVILAEERRRKALFWGGVVTGFVGSGVALTSKSKRARQIATFAGVVGVVTAFVNR